MIAIPSGLVSIPDDLSSTDAAPLLCAGMTTYNALRRSSAEPGDLAAVQGVGGLGHLGVHFAAHMGFRVAAIARGPEKGAARQATRSASLHRQQSGRSSGCFTATGWGKGSPGDGIGEQVGVRTDRRPMSARSDDRRRCRKQPKSKYRPGNLCSALEESKEH
jgi:hypothetical protein